MTELNTYFLNSLMQLHSRGCFVKLQPQHLNKPLQVYRYFGSKMLCCEKCSRPVLTSMIFFRMDLNRRVKASAFFLRRLCPFCAPFSLNFMLVKALCEDNGLNDISFSTCPLLIICCVRGLVSFDTFKT